MQPENKERLIVAEDGTVLLDALADFVPGPSEHWLDPEQI